MDEFAYAIGQKVVVKPIDLHGVVLQRCDRGGGQHDYQVVFWCESRRQVEWLMPHELAPVRAP